MAPDPTPPRTHTLQPRPFTRLYISGPMTGLPDFNFPAFHAAAAQLRRQGWQVVNPAEINPDGAMPWHQCMRADIKALCDCDAIVMLPGWSRSDGAALELHLAQRLKLEVLMLEDLVHTTRPAGYTAAVA